MSRGGFRIAPSLLAADFARLGEEVTAVVAAGADMIHLDVMDNHYVPNLSLGPAVCAAIRPLVAVPLEVHLMVRPVDSVVPAFAEAGADIISFHPDATAHVDRTMALIRHHGCRVGMVVNPAASLSCLDYTLARLDLVLLMTVNPGFGGQSFIPYVLDKIGAVRGRIDRLGREVILEVDGGVHPNNIALAAAAGADSFVAGSAIFGAPDYRATIAEMRRRLEDVQGPAAPCVPHGAVRGH